MIETLEHLKKSVAVAAADVRRRTHQLSMGDPLADERFL